MIIQQKNQQNQQKNQRIQKMKAIDLSERQKQILAYMDAGVEYSTEQVAEKIGLKGPRTRQLLNELVNMELLACIGTTKKRRYIKV
jgi:predicted HTH transcriptional regulator